MSEQELAVLKQELVEFTQYYDTWWQQLFDEHNHIFKVGEIIDFPEPQFSELKDRWKSLHELNKFLAIDLAKGNVMREVVQVLEELYADPELTPAPLIDPTHKLELMDRMFKLGR
jgi:ABC-type uncharacterized transport system ATPase subunit